MYSDLLDFVINRMRMSHIYQPVMLMTLLRSGGEADARTIASDILAYDRTQLDYYVAITHNMVGKVLRSHGIVERSGKSDFYTLRGFNSLSGEEREDLIRKCQDRVDDFLDKHGDRVFEHRRRLYPEPEPELPGSPRDESCDFCSVGSDRIVDENSLAFLISDAYPVTNHHSLVIPKRHVPTYFDLSGGEIDACTALLRTGKNRIEKIDSTVCGFNIGVNNGEAAGQTVFHAHIHLIPRRHGDVENPRGGVRGMIPGKGAY